MTAALPDDALTFARSQLDIQMNAIGKENLEFETFFAANGIEPVRVHYEQLLDKPQEAIDMIGKRVGFRQRLHVERERLTLSKQRGALNDEWRQRYLAPTLVERIGGQWERIKPRSG